MEIDENIELWDAYNNNFTKIDGMVLQRGKSIDYMNQIIII